MKVFISWSGKLSGGVATYLKEWLPLAVPGTEIWLSKTDIEKGSIWFSDIQAAIEETSVGVICLTRENMNRPWILFETGALNKGLTKSRVCPLLLNLSDKELEAPLKEFNNAKPDKEDMLKLCMMINGFNKSPATEARLKEYFQAFWPRLESKLKELMESDSESVPPKKREMPEMLEEVLETVRALLRITRSGSPVHLTPSFTVIDPDQAWLNAYEVSKALAKLDRKGDISVPPIQSIAGVNPGQAAGGKWGSQVRATPEEPPKTA